MITATPSTPQNLRPNSAADAASAFETGLRKTVGWYLDQEDWWRDVTSGAYKAWIDKNYGFRIAV